MLTLLGSFGLINEVRSFPDIYSLKKKNNNKKEKIILEKHTIILLQHVALDHLILPDSC